MSSKSEARRYLRQLAQRPPQTPAFAVGQRVDAWIFDLGAAYAARIVYVRAGSLGVAYQVQPDGGKDRYWISESDVYQVLPEPDAPAA